MKQERIRITQQKGINRFANQLNTPPDWLYDIYNGYIDKENNIVKRSGIVKYNSAQITGYSTGLTIKALFESKWSTGNKRMICRHGTAWYKEDGDTVWDVLDGTRTSDAEGRAVMSQISGNDVLVMTDGGTARQSNSAWSVSNLTADANFPADPQVCHMHNEHLIVNSATISKVYISAFRAITDFTTANDALIIDLRYVLPTSDRPIDFKSMGNDLLAIICTNYILIYNAPPDTRDWSILAIIKTGAVSSVGNIIHPDTNELVTCMIQGIDIIGQTSDLTATGQKDPFLSIQPYYRDLLALKTANIVMCYNKKVNQIYIHIPNSSTTGETLIYSLDIGAVVGRYVHLNISAGVAVFGSICCTETGVMLAGGNDGYVYTMDSGSQDNGISFAFSIETPYYYGKDSRSYKICRDAGIVMTNPGLVLTAFVHTFTWDLGSTTTITSAVTELASEPSVVVKYSGLLGRGYAFKSKWSNTDTKAITISEFWYDLIYEGTK